MSEQREQYTVQALLKHDTNHATLDVDKIVVSRAEIEKEHSLLIARLHQLRRWLGYPPLLTGKEIERQGRNSP